MLLLILYGILLIPLLYIGLTFPVKYLMILRFFSRLKKSKSICLTFDDGPHPLATPRILRILKKEGIKATFFLLGKNAEKYPELVSEIKKEGHDIGEHGYGHCHPWKNFPATCITDIKKGSGVLKPWRGEKTRSLYRPPYGKFTIVSLLYLLLVKKSKIIFWNLDTRDYEQDTGRAVADRIISAKVHGSIILMHDGRDELDEAKIKPTIEGLQLALEQLREYKPYFKTISEALDTM